MKLLHLLALFFSLQPGSAVTEYHVWSDTSAACPTESCLTFNEYVSDTETYFNSNTSFTFLEGEHYLDSALVIDGKSDITMRASTNASVTITLSSNAFIQFRDSLAFVLSSLVIHHLGSHKSALKLVNSHNIQLTGIKFEKIALQGVFVQYSTARITNCSFFNAAGGGASFRYSTVEFLGHVSFIGNYKSGNGGAISAQYSALSVYGNTVFANNVAVRCGGAIATWDSTLSVYGNIAFENNRASFDGGAITVAAQSSVLSISGDITFTNNRAPRGGAIFITGASDVQLLGNTAFRNNSVYSYSGGAIYTSGSRLTLSGTTTFTGNKAIRGGGLALESGAHVFCLNTSEVIFLQNTAEFGGAVHIEQSDLQLLGNSTFENNSAMLSGGAIHTTSGGISLSGWTTFTRNTAPQGGGIALESSAQLHFLLQDPLEVIFLRNEAEIGGAMFIDDSIVYLCSDAEPACFFDVDVDSPVYTKIHLNFSLNSASQSGPVIFGGSLGKCQVNYQLGTGIEFFMRTSSISTTDVSSDPLNVCLCANGAVANCATESYSVKVKRGELFNISLITVGQLNTPAPAGILANSDNIGDVRLDPQFPASNGTCINVGISLFAGEHVSNKTLYLYPDGPCGNPGGDMARARIGIEIMLEECPPGFDLNLDHCDCEKRLFSLINEGNITCDINDDTISLRGNAWI